jgi:hypothetical protein
MPADDFNMAEQMIPRFEARDQLVRIAASAYPHSKKSWQDKYHRSMHDSAKGPSHENDGPVLSLGELVGRIGRG